MDDAQYISRGASDAQTSLADEIGAQTGHIRSDVPERPAWFAGKREDREAQEIRKRAPARPPATAAPESPQTEVNESWPERIVSWFVSDDAKGFGTSVVFHILLLIFCSFIIIHSTKPNAPFSTEASEADDRGVEMDDSISTEIEIADIETESIQPPQFQQIPIPTQQAPRSAILTDLEQNIASLFGTSDGEGDAGDPGFRPPGNGKFVRKGSFTAWTVPEDPAPGEAYFIIIHVELPKRIRNYDPRDLTGFMRGTDGYKTAIGFYRGKYFGEFNKRAKQLVIRIPGAAANVRDTIHVESRVLREKQDLEIVF